MRATIQTPTSGLRLHNQIQQRLPPSQPIKTALGVSFWASSFGSPKDAAMIAICIDKRYGKRFYAQKYLF